ncbi:MAG: class I SAM-dependent methyltransferase [Actinomycetota bacterium]|nr:class I SAM-dependent methyltransferase [Actinomycetota bacterium]
MDLADSRRPVAGNSFDKYGSSDPVVRRVMAGFFRALDRCWAQAGPFDSLLDVGCGEGWVTRTWARRRPDAEVVGVDREDPRLRRHWNEASEPNVTFIVGDALALPHDDCSFDVVSAIELLEQVDDPAQALRELTRCARRAVIVSVPREPLWRALNVGSGRYVGALGNSPGTRNHWSARAFEGLVAEHATVERVETPLPWTIVLARP